MATDASDAGIDRAVARLLETRPTAVNLPWAVGEMERRVCTLPVAE